VHWFGVVRAMRVIASAKGCCHGLMSKRCEIAKSSATRGRPLLKILKSTFATTLCNGFRS
jgi:hypothetical protein